MHKSTDKI